MQTTLNTGAAIRDTGDASEGSDPQYRWIPWVALAFMTLCHVGTFANEFIGDEERARRIVFWGLAQIAVISLWWTGRARHIAPVTLVFCMEALKVACEKWSGDVGEIRTTIAVSLLTAAQIGTVAVMMSAWFGAHPKARRFGIQLMVGSSAVYAVAVLFNMLVREVVRQ